MSTAGATNPTAFSFDIVNRALGVQPLVFQASGVVVLPGSLLIAGKTIDIHYDSDRLCQNRASIAGVPVWFIRVHYKMSNTDGESPVRYKILEQTKDAKLMHTLIHLPLGTKSISMWFENSSAGSEGGKVFCDKSYNFPVYPMTNCSISFFLDWITPEVASVIRSESVGIKYDIRRLKAPISSWDDRTPRSDQLTEHFKCVRVYYRFDHGTPCSQLLESPDKEGICTTTVGIQEGSHQISMWFSGDGQMGSRYWDSAGMKNFSWNVKPTKPKVLTFLNNWEHKLSGPLVAGDTLILRYNQFRLPRNRAQGWYIKAHVRYKGYGQEDEVRGLEEEEPGGGVMACRLDVPVWATRLALWFENGGGRGTGTPTDRDDKNYSLDVARNP
eukprot:TRINITY_DN27637_c0_g2_i2.p1 TRINITY_DN27637_c0_g2~~TRINITY_DN27637_c0_g2_i2.p1  ORF type:complete len:428 (-),score=110.24 TRINITY_DN27637_c0_g2_i2:56-1210(-)